MIDIPKWDGNDCSATLGSSQPAMSYEEIIGIEAGIPEMTVT